MINFKKMDDEDFVFINKPVDKNEEKEFSDFLKNRNIRNKRTRSPRYISLTAISVPQIQQ